MNEPEEPQKLDAATSDPAENPRQPFRPEIVGDLRKRLFKYAEKKHRSAQNAVNWLLLQQLSKEGF